MWGLTQFFNHPDPESRQKKIKARMHSDLSKLHSLKEIGLRHLFPKTAGRRLAIESRKYDASIFLFIK